MMNMVEQSKSRGVEMPEKIQFRSELHAGRQARDRVGETNYRVVEMPSPFHFRFEKLTVWQSARRLSADIYAATQNFPKDELFGLTSQLRRAAVSITANIAEAAEIPMLILRTSSRWLMAQPWNWRRSCTSRPILPVSLWRLETPC
jgi:hypothetical protein